MVGSSSFPRFKELSGNSAQSLAQNGPELPLCALLERAGLEEDACAIVLEPDRGVPKEGAIPPGPISCARSLSRAKALQREVLIAKKTAVRMICG
jgi:hypothetical protein